MTKVGLIRRINLGNYQHYELFIEIDDEYKDRALMRCIKLMNKGLYALGEPQIDISKIKYREVTR